MPEDRRLVFARRHTTIALDALIKNWPKIFKTINNIISGVGRRQDLENAFTFEELQVLENAVEFLFQKRAYDLVEYLETR